LDQDQINQIWNFMLTFDYLDQLLSSNKLFLQLESHNM